MSSSKDIVVDPFLFRNFVSLNYLQIGIRPTRDGREIVYISSPGNSWTREELVASDSYRGFIDGYMGFSVNPSKVSNNFYPSALSPMNFFKGIFSSNEDSTSADLEDSLNEEIPDVFANGIKNPIAGYNYQYILGEMKRLEE